MSAHKPSEACDCPDPRAPRPYHCATVTEPVWSATYRVVPDHDRYTGDLYVEDAGWRDVAMLLIDQHRTGLNPQWIRVEHRAEDGYEWMWRGDHWLLYVLVRGIPMPLTRQGEEGKP